MCGENQRIKPAPHAHAYFTPPPSPSIFIVDAAYEGMQERTFLAMSLMVVTTLPVLVGLIVLCYCSKRFLNGKDLTVDDPSGGVEAAGEKDEEGEDDGDSTELTTLINGD